MTIWNLGSVNADHIHRVPRFPDEGETLAADGYVLGLGGKGANMSVAAVRAGARVEHLGQVGRDGVWMRDLLRAWGVSVSHLVVGDTPSGHAFIAVTPDGANRIVLHPGANVALDPDRIAAALSGAAPGDTLMCQNETTLQVEAARIARARGLRVAYVAAPFVAGDAVRMLPFTDLLIVNEIEARQLEAATGAPTEALPVRDVVVTLGARGGRWIAPAGGGVRDFAAPRVEAVDTTAAGDTFAGYLLAGLDGGASMAQALDLAARAAALKVTRAGTAEAIPTRAEVVNWQV